MRMALRYLIGVDGGGSGTRLCLADTQGHILTTQTGGPSALGQGIEAAWQTITGLCQQAFNQQHLTFNPAECGIGLGLSGVHNPQWAHAFQVRAPGFGHLQLDTDAFTTLLGAHAGAPGAVVAIGTGSVGEALYADGSRRGVGGWGWTSGDEASGAWLGKHASARTQKALDGRLPDGPLAAAVIQHCGGSADHFMAWLGEADQNAYAQLAPLVLQHSDDDTHARPLLQQAGQEVALLAQALDPEGTLPLALCGGLAQALTPWLPEALRQRIRPAQGDSMQGALILIQKAC
ncbi:BadF/BadG/BcrA/BcrD ATPase family protein [Leeia aquatica]|nr:BadF/BadG/BcrA/BcrD ATPase family protein [Leeia aquatica]